MHRDTIDRAGVDHHRQRTSQGRSLKGLKIFLAQHLWRDVCWCAVLTCPGGTIGKIVLGTGTHMILVDMIRVVTLIALNLCCHHLRIDDGIFAKALIDARPAWVTAQVDNRIIHPWAIGCTTFVGSNLCTHPNQFGVKRSGHIDWLRKQRTTLRIGYAMVVVETVDVRNADMLHRLLLNQLYPLLPLCHRCCPSAWCVQYRAHLPFRYQRVKHGLVELPLAIGIVLAHDVEVQLQHLANLLVKCHLLECLLHLGLQLCIARNSKLC